LCLGRDTPLMFQDSLMSSEIQCQLLIEGRMNCCTILPKE
jgi:hypothetical protein